MEPGPCDCGSYDPWSRREVKKAKAARTPPLEHAAKVQAALEEARAHALPGPVPAASPEADERHEQHQHKLLQREAELRLQLLARIDTENPSWDTVGFWGSPSHQAWAAARRDYVQGDDTALRRMLAAVTHEDPPLAVITPPSLRRRPFRVPTAWVIVLTVTAMILFLGTVAGVVHWTWNG